MNADQFRDIFYVLHNIDKSDLEAAGVITIGANGGSDWNRFNSDVGTFVLKLRQENLEALFELVRSRLPVTVAQHTRIEPAEPGDGRGDAGSNPAGRALKTLLNLTKFEFKGRVVPEPWARAIAKAEAALEAS